MPLRHHLQPLHDYQLAKKYAWNPQTLDLNQDQFDWARLSPVEQGFMTHLCSLFVAGEEAVASDLAPLLWALGKSGGLREEEMFLASQIFDESVHVEFFHRWFEEVVVQPINFKSYWTPSYAAIFGEALPQALEALLTDQSPTAFVRALLNYHIIVEGVLAETGYQAIFTACQRNGILPGLAQGVSLVKRDESRHIAYGIYALQRLVGSDRALMQTINDITHELLVQALGVIPEALERYGSDIPFGITLTEFVEYASDQFAKRFAAIERAVA